MHAVCSDDVWLELRSYVMIDGLLRLSLQAWHLIKVCSTMAKPQILNHLPRSWLLL